jgi:hypothetical protein
MKNTFIILFFVLTACCTKKDCDFTEIPQVVLKVSKDTLTGYNKDQIKNLTVRIFDKSFLLIDSIKPFDYWDYYQQTYYQPIIRIDKFSLERIGKSEISQFNYVFHIAGDIDTLSEINYSLKSDKVECNSCFPFGDGSATQVSVDNFTYNFNQAVITSKTDTLILKK